MPASPKWKSLASSARGRFGLILLLIAAASAVPRLFLGSYQSIEYDGYWHIFIAQQDNWHNFWAEIGANAHPPLYFLLLKAILRFGSSLLVYRSISIVTGIATVPIVGWLARKITESDTLGALSALAYGLALPAIIVSCEVRSYMLSAFFILLSFWCLLEVLGPGMEVPGLGMEVPGSGKAADGETGSRAKARAGFAVAAILACLSHYYAFFYSGAAIVLLFYRFGWNAIRGEVASWKRAAAAEFATTLPVAAAILTLYEVHAQNLADIQSHLLPYYLDPRGHERVAAFLLRNWKNVLNLFSPFPVSSGALALAIFALGLIGLIATGGLLQRAQTAAARMASATVLMTGIVLAGIALLAVKGKYPFGGDLRQQFILFPFLVLSLAVFLERIGAGFARLVPARACAVAAAAVAVAAVSAVRYEQYPKSRVNVLADRVAVFNRVAGQPAAVYVDQFNLITFFIYHHDWHWHYVKLAHPLPGIEVYRLTRGADRMFVFRDLGQWDADPGDANVYRTLAQCLKAGTVPDVSVFGVRQVPPKAPLADLVWSRREMVTMAADSSVCVDRMEVTPLGWYATFRQSNCAKQDVEPIPRAQPEQQTADRFIFTSTARLKGRIAANSSAVQYVGAWTQGPDGSGMYSKDPGAVARLSFSGADLTLVYFKGLNRGIAEVKLDGIPRGEIDLYSRGAVSEARTVYRGLGSGEHTVEVVVSGRKNAAAADRIVDVGGMIVH